MPLGRRSAILLLRDFAPAGWRSHQAVKSKFHTHPTSGSSGYSVRVSASRDLFFELGVRSQELGVKETCNRCQYNCLFLITDSVRCSVYIYLRARYTPLHSLKILPDNDLKRKTLCSLHSTPLHSEAFSGSSVAECSGV